MPSMDKIITKDPTQTIKSIYLRGTRNLLTNLHGNDTRRRSKILGKLWIILNFLNHAIVDFHIHASWEFTGDKELCMK
jgi:hypothetical protein